MRPRTVLIVATLLLLAAAPGPGRAAGPDPLEPAAAERFARLALDCVHREYPNKIAHVMQADADAGPPRELTPAFFGCFDWHSAVHGHWLLARWPGPTPMRPFAPAARAALERSLTPEKIAVEVAYLRRRGPRDVRAALRPGLAAAAGRRAARVGRCRGHSAGPTTCARWSERAAARLAAGCPSCRTRSAPASTARPPSPSGWCSTGRGSAGDEEMSDLLEERGHALYTGGPGLPSGLRAIGPGLPVALPGRGRPDAPGPRTGGLRRLAGRRSCPASRRTARPAGCPCRWSPTERTASWPIWTAST